jgi:NAD(P)-dependent dehydrogenase (short-subunit alcohol dehydrogenase family)
MVSIGETGMKRHDTYMVVSGRRGFAKMITDHDQADQLGFGVGARVFYVCNYADDSAAKAAADGLAEKLAGLTDRSWKVKAVRVGPVESSVADDAFHLLQDAAEKFAAAGLPEKASEVYRLVERLAEGI